MLRVFIVALFLSCCLCLSVFTEDGHSAQEFKEILEKDQMSRMYDRAVEFFTQNIPAEFEYRLNNSYKYIDLIKAIFGEKGIPHEIAYLPLIESGFSPASVGAGDAAGLWQFVRLTAQRYDLRMDLYIDERKDPVKSTYAAAAYLRDLYSVFGRWDFVLGAYNAGEGKIRRIISKNNNGPLPAGISRYIARLLAVFTVAQEPEEYGIMSKGYAQTGTGDYREITTHRSISLEKIAAQYKTTVIAIRELNPAMLRNETPPYKYVIRVPVNY